MALPAKIPDDSGVKLNVKTMSVADAEKAMRKAGMLTLRARQIQGTKEVGDYLTQIGVLSYGRAVLAFTTEQARKTMDKLQKVMSKKDCPDSVKMECAKLVEALGDQSIKSATALVESSTIDSSHGASPVPPTKSFTPGATIVPIHAEKVELTVGNTTPPTPCENT